MPLFNAYVTFKKDGKETKVGYNEITLTVEASDFNSASHAVMTTLSQDGFGNLPIESVRVYAK